MQCTCGAYISNKRTECPECGALYPDVETERAVSESGGSKVQTAEPLEELTVEREGSKQLDFFNRENGRGRRAA